MKVKELILKLEMMPEMDECEVVMPDYAPIVDVVSSDYGDGCVILTDQEPNEGLDIDEQMHEQQERDREYAEVYADMYSDLI